MVLTPSQTTHLAALVELTNRYGAGVTYEQLQEHVWGGKRSTRPTVTRAINSLEEAGMLTVVDGAAPDNPATFHPTDKGRAAVAEAGALGTEGN